ncbi:yteA family sporulation protein [Priestia megaterium]|nr:yteA family sporulation protein [Priestia megaterium]
MLSNEQLAQLKKTLLTQQKELDSHFDQNDHFDLIRSGIHDSTGELSSYDNHPGDTATEIYEREKDLALNEHMKEEVEEIKTALQAMAEKAYGVCKACGKEIPFERLQAIPTTLYCKEHSPSQHTSTTRPIEETVLHHPFGQYELDEKGITGYDSEDTWQDVARYGTSESPSDFIEDTELYSETYVEADENLGYVEAYENFAATDLYGNEIFVYPSKQHEQYEQALDDEGIMTVFGDLPPYEKEPYTE